MTTDIIMRKVDDCEHKIKINVDGTIMQEIEFLIPLYIQLTEMLSA